MERKRNSGPAGGEHPAEIRDVYRLGVRIRRSALVMAAWALIVTLGLPGEIAPGREKASASAPAIISLTLVPPSPVTNQITLDVRGAVRNSGDTTARFDVAFYLDREDGGSRLHRETTEVAPQSAAGIKFLWPTKNHAGRHEIILVAKSGAAELRACKPVQILPSTVRSTRQIDGAWAGLYHWSEHEGRLWNADIKRLTDDQWREIVRDMHGIGMDIIVIQEVFRNQEYVDKHSIERDGYGGRAFFPSKLFPGRVPIAAKDPVDAILSEADKLGMSVMLGVGLYAWFDFTPGSLAWHKKVADELWHLYGHHPSFYGWYVSEEVGGNLGPDDRHREALVDFFREFTAQVRRLTPDKPVMLASNCFFIREAGGYYAKILPHLDILCPFGFHRMPAGDTTGEEAAAQLQKYCDAAGSHLWLDLEAFVFDKDGALIPRPIGGLLDDLNRFPGFEKILCYQYPGLMNSPDMSLKPGGPATVKLYLDYAKYLKEKKS
jgi:hypothetical protein